jgi:hypothetical protein
MRREIGFCLMAVAILALAAPASGQGRLKRYESKYYVLQTDLEPDFVREAESRITAMAEEYYERTKHFAGKITRKFPFYLYSNPADYYKAGGLPGSAGVFNGEKLMAIGNAQLGLDVWHVIQHEGFHQFAHAVIGGDIPIWMHEGLAEYFGEGVFTGDGYVLGIVPPARAARIKQYIQGGQTISIKDMMKMKHEVWNGQMSPVNYDQAWSMIYFLAHGKNGRYQKALNEFLRLTSHGSSWEEAWATAFGRGVADFEKQWKEYWEQMPGNPTPELVARASLATLTSFYARAFSQKQYFETAEEFFAAAKSGKLKFHAQDWLPESLLQRELKRYERIGDWELVKRGAKKELSCTTHGGEKLFGQFQITTAGRVKQGGVSVVAAAVKPPP